VTTPALHQQPTPERFFNLGHCSTEERQHAQISGNQHGYVREVNPKGETVWEINKNDLPGITLYAVPQVDRLANGNTVICNWPGSLPLADWPSVVQITEVTPAKEVVWALRGWKTVGPASAIQLLDEPGVPEKGDCAKKTNSGMSGQVMRDTRKTCLSRNQHLSLEAK